MPYNAGMTPPPSPDVQAQMAGQSPGQDLAGMAPPGAAPQRPPANPDIMKAKDLIDQIVRMVPDLAPAAEILGNRLIQAMGQPAGITSMMQPPGAGAAPPMGMA